MKVVTVTPINKGIFKEHLTYFSAQPVSLGIIVTVPVKSRQVSAMVVSVEEASSLKSELKNSDFALKKLSEIKSRSLFQPGFLTACQKTADYFATNLGQTIKSLTPKVILENLDANLGSPEISPEEPADDSGTVRQNKFVLQDEEAERIVFYKSLIRESFAKKTSVFLCLPTIADVEKMSESFDKGIKDYTVVLHNNQPAKSILDNWRKALKNEHPILVIATPMFLSLPRTDIKTLILDKENTTAYKDLSRPYIDYRLFAEHLADALKIRLIFGDLVLRSETIFKTENGHFTPISPLKYRSPSQAEQIVLESGKKDSNDHEVRAIEKELALLLNDALAGKEKFLLYCGRKGLAPNTVCNDCGTLVSCSSCQSPLVLHKNNKFLTKSADKYVYFCHKCGLVKKVEDKCPTCGSWRLALLGFGIDRVEEELRELFPTVPLFRLDKGTVSTTKKAKEIVAKFTSTKGPAILLATEVVVPILTEKISNVALVTIDSLFTLPDFRISEKLLNVMLKLREFAYKRFIIQTRNPQEKVFGFATRGNLLDFYREEIEERMRFGYPPFKLMIKITREGKEQEVTEDMNKLAALLADYEPSIFPAFISQIKNRYRMHALIKLPAGKGIPDDLLRLLKSLPPVWNIDVEPESIL